LVNINSYIKMHGATIKIFVVSFNVWQRSTAVTPLH